MSLITRCPACGTMFKVVTDQLKVSQGWVRCGHCGEVFDGTAHLLADEITEISSSPPARDETSEVEQAPELASAAQLDEPADMARDDAEPEWAPARSFADRAPLMPALSRKDDVHDRAADFDPASWKQAQQRRQQHEAESSAEPVVVPVIDTLPDRSSLEQTASANQSGSEPSVAPNSELDDSDALDDVSFVRDARRKAFWKRPLIRGTLALLSILLLSTMVLQWMVQQRDSLAEQEPRLALLLQALCGQLGCEIRLPRHIESLVIDSSTFNKIGPDAYQLGFTLKNTGAIALEIPSLEVTLTDTQDQALVRRVLVPAQFGAQGTALTAHSELTGTVSMKVSGDEPSASAPSQQSVPLRVAGYRILAFYP